MSATIISLRNVSRFVMRRRGILTRQLSVYQNPTTTNITMQQRKITQRQFSCSSFKSTSKVSTSFDVQDEEDFNDRVMNSKIPIVVDFHAEWCGPCKSLGPKIKKVVDSYDGKVFLAKVDIDEVSEIAMKYNVRVVPTVVGIKNGGTVEKFEGDRNEGDIETFVENLISEEKK